MNSFQFHKIKKIILQCLPEALLDSILTLRTHYSFYQNINCKPRFSEQKRILISYITAPLEAPTFLSLRHTNIAECAEIIKIFTNLGYVIDVIHCLDEKHNDLIAEKKYEVIFGLGEPFYIASINNPKALKIIYLTESHPSFSLQQEKLRVDYYFERHKQRVPLKRSGLHYKVKDISVANYGILVGNKITLQTYTFSAERIFTLNPTGLINENFVFTKRDRSESRKHFVWFGSGGAIHKGLDILIDVFNELPEYHLYICGLSAQEKKLFAIKGKNIHDLGFIYVESSEFMDLMQTCSYVILPSCSEGMATSVLTCMNHGLIPVVTRECGIDLKEWGVYLEDYSVEYIRGSVEHCASIEPDLVEKYQNEVYEYSRRQFVISRYSQDLQHIVNTIISKETEKS